MWMNQFEIESAASCKHDCPNVRKGVRLLFCLMQAVNEQSDGWAYWPAPAHAADKLMNLLHTAGNLQFGTHNTISEADLRKAIRPIRAMVTREKKRQAKYGNKFDFDVDAALMLKIDPAGEGTALEQRADLMSDEERERWIASGM